MPWDNIDGNHGGSACAFELNDWGCSQMVKVKVSTGSEDDMFGISHGKYHSTKFVGTTFDNTNDNGIEISSLCMFARDEVIERWTKIKMSPLQVKSHSLMPYLNTFIKLWQFY